MKEQISMEFARELLDEIEVFFKANPLNEKHNGYTELNWTYDLDRTFKNWKQKGYIKQSREEEIRGKIEEEKTAKYPINYQYFYREAIELIKILDNKIKEKNNE